MYIRLLRNLVLVAVVGMVLTFPQFAQAQAALTCSIQNLKRLDNGGYSVDWVITNTTSTSIDLTVDSAGLGISGVQQPATTPYLPEHLPLNPQSAKTVTFTFSTLAGKPGTSVIFTVGAHTVAAAQITGYLQYNFPVSLPYAAISSLTVSPLSIIGGSSANGQIGLNDAAPPTGAIVTLTSSNTSVVQVPQSVNIGGGLKTGTFAITTSVVKSNISVTINATFGNVTKSVTLTVWPKDTALVESVAFSSPIVEGGTKNCIGTVKLTAPATLGGASVSLTSGSLVSVPVSVTVAQGQRQADFKITTELVSSTTQVPVTASYNASQVTAILTLTALPGAIPTTVGVADVNGDGKSDLIVQYDDHWGQRYIQAWLSTGNSFKNLGSIWTLTTPTTYVAGVADVNGDGKADLIVQWDQNGSRNWQVWLSTGSYFRDWGTIWKSTSVAQNVTVDGVADVDGDGKADLIVHWDQNGSRNWQVWLGTNGLYFKDWGTIWASASTAQNINVVGAADVNGDGKADLIVQFDDHWGQRYIQSWLSTGNSFKYLGNNWAVTSVDMKMDGVADVTGDRVADLIVHNDNLWGQRYWQAWLSTGGLFRDWGSIWASF